VQEEEEGEAADAAESGAPALWAARSAVACPGCPWGDTAWHGGCALISRWWSAPAAPSCRGSRFDSSCRAPRHGVRPCCCGVSASR
jgi:hypothetical protein